MPAGLQGWHLVVLLVLILLLFGAAKLPALAKSVGQSARVFKGEMKALKEDDAKDAASAPATAAESTLAREAPPAQSSATDTKP